MQRLRFVLLALALMSCAQSDHAAVESQASVASTDTLRAQMRAQFGILPDSLEVRNGARIRLVYVDTGGRNLSARAMQAAYTEDSLQFDRAFDQAVWLWTTAARTAAVDTISIRFIALEHDQGAPLHSAEYYFYTKQLENPAVRPVLDREAVGPNQSDTLPARGGSKS